MGLKNCPCEEVLQSSRFWTLSDHGFEYVEPPISKQYVQVSASENVSAYRWERLKYTVCLWLGLRLCLQLRGTGGNPQWRFDSIFKI